MSRHQQWRVLLIAQDENTYQTVVSLLAAAEDERFVLDRVATGAAGLAKILRHRHDVYLIDDDLGDQTGLVLLEQAAVLQSVGPLILLVAHDDQALDIAALDAGAANTLVKATLTPALLARTMHYAIKQHRHLLDVHQQSEYLATLHAMSLALMSGLHVDDLLHTIISNTATLVGSQDAFVAIADETGQSLEVKVGIGTFKDMIGTKLKRGEGVSGTVLQTGQPIIVEDYVTWPGKAGLPWDKHTGAIAAPLSSGGQTIGSISVWHVDEGKAFRQQDLDMLVRFGQLASIALDNARLYTAAQHELSERRRIEHSFWQSEARFRAIFHGGLDACFVYKSVHDEHDAIVDFTVVDLNPRAEYLVKMSRDDAIGKSVRDIAPSQHSAQMFELFNHVVSSGEPYEVEISGKNSRGEEGWVQLQIVPLGDGVLNNVRNITPHKELQKSLSTTRDRLAAVLDSTNDAIMMLDLDGRLLLANRRIAQLFHSDAKHSSEATGQYALPELLHHITNPERFLAATEALLSDPTRQDTGELALAGSPVRILVWYSSPVRSDSGEIIGRSFVFRDATLEKEADRLKNEFVARVSHELRTPLTSIKGFTEIILDGDAGEIGGEVREFLDIVHTSADQLVAIVNDILDVTGIDAGKVVLKRQPVALYPAIHASTLALQPLFLQRQQHVSVVVPEDLPAAHADPERLNQILINLITNAHKYTPPGGMIRVSARRATEHDRPHLTHIFPHQSEENDNHGFAPTFDLAATVIVEISDTGIGIAAHQLDRIFQRFYRVNNSDTVEVGGTGLGLSITHGLIELHGGTIWVESQPGHGSTFAFSLPMADQRPTTNDHRPTPMYGQRPPGNHSI